MFPFLSVLVKVNEPGQSGAAVGTRSTASDAHAGQATPMAEGIFFPYAHEKCMLRFAVFFTQSHVLSLRTIPVEVTSLIWC